MNSTRRIALLGCLALLAAAVWGASAPAPARDRGPAPRPPRDAAAARAAAVLFDLDEVTARLRSRMKTLPTPRTPGRNPFEFERVTPPTPAVRMTHAPVAPAAPAAPAPPPLTLSGVAETKQGDQIVRTAILSGMGQLFYAKPGDRIADRFDVTIVGPDIVELRDTVGGTVLRLAMR